MTTMIFDTLKFANHLKQAGVASAHAEAEAIALAEVFEVSHNELASKADLVLLKTELKAELSELRSDIQSLEQRMSSQMSSLEQRMSSQMLSLEQRMTIKLGSLMVVAIGVVAVLVKLL